MDVLEAIAKNNPNLLKVKLGRKDFDINATIYDESQEDGNVAVATPLVYACENQLTETVELLIKNGADVNKSAEDAKKRTPLYVAAFLGDLALVKLLVSNNADINKIPESGLSALHTAIEKDHYEIAKWLIEQKADVNIRIDECDIGTPLYHATNSAMKSEYTRLLVENGAKVDLKPTKSSRTPFLNAVANGKSEILEVLLDGGADINALDDGQSAVHLAIAVNSGKCLKILLERNAAVNIKYKGLTPFFQWILQESLKMDAHNIIPILDKHTKEELEEFVPTGDTNNTSKITMLMLAVQKADASIISKLIAKGVDVNKKTSNGDTALHYIFYNQDSPSVENIELLLKHGANPLESNAAEITPFYYLLKGNWCNHDQDHKIMQLMIDYSKDLNINERDYNGNGDTPLTLAAGSKRSRRDLIEVLLANGADINAANRDGQTALHFACLQVDDSILSSYEKNSPSMLSIYEKNSPVKLLLEKGAKIQLNNSGAYPYFLAHYQNDFKTFMKHGTDMNTQNDNGDTVLHYIIKTSPPKMYWTVTALLESTEELDLTLMNKDGKTVYDLVPDCAESFSRGSFARKFDKYKEDQSKYGERQRSKDEKELSTSSKTTNTTKPSCSTEVKKERANLPATSSSASPSSLKSSSSKILKIVERKSKKTALKLFTKKNVKRDESKSSDSNVNQVSTDPKKKENMSSSKNDAQKNHKDVMISYQWDNQKTAVKLRDYLVINGKLNVWMDVTDMSEDINEAMARGVAYSSIFVMCMSQKYAESVNCKKEYSYADRLRKYIIPVKVQSDFSPTLGTALDLIVGANIYYDLDADFNNQAKKLMDDINKYLNPKQ